MLWQQAVWSRITVGPGGFHTRPGTRWLRLHMGTGLGLSAPGVSV